MNRGRSLILSRALLSLIALALGFPQRRAWADARLAFRQDVSHLCRTPHRIAGTEACQEAARYIERRLGDLGIRQVWKQRFPVPVLRTSATLCAGDRTVPLAAMQECLWQAPVSGPEPIRGHAVYLPSGTLETCPTGSLEGAVVVFPYDRALRWRDAFALGARAVIFVGDHPGHTDVARYEPLEADLPRFHLSEEDARTAGILTGCPPVEIVAQAQWGVGSGENVLAWIPGTNAVFHFGAEEVFIFSAQMDTYGQVPTRVQGAEGAVNCAVLLALAERLARTPPARHVLFAFLGAEARCLAGASAFYNAIFRAKPFPPHLRTHADFVAEHEAETAFLVTVCDVLTASGFPVGRSEAARHALDLLRRQADYEAEEIRVRLRDLRLQRDALRERAPEAGERLPHRIEALRTEEQEWNALRRALAKEVDGPEIGPRLDQVRRKTLEMLEGRLRELGSAIEQRRQALAIGALLTNRVIVLHLTLDLSDGGPRWGVAHGDDDSHLPKASQNNVGYYVGVFAALEEAARSCPGLRLFEPQTVQVQLGPPLYFPAPTLHAGQMASRFGVYGLRIATCHDRRLRRGHPIDRLDDLDLEAIEAQVEDALPFLQTLPNHPSLSVRQRIRPTALYLEPEWKGARMDGCTVMTRSFGSPIANVAARGALLARANRWTTLSGFDLAWRTVVFQNGYAALGPWPVLNVNDPWCCVLQDTHGRTVAINAPPLALERLELFPCRPRTVAAMAAPDFRTSRSQVFNALNDGPFMKNESLVLERESVVSFFVPPSAPGFKLINRYGLILLNADAESPTGRGIPLQDGSASVNTEQRAAEDVWTLNEHRLSILRRHRLANDALEFLHGLAATARYQAQAATNAMSRVGEWGLAAALNRRVYLPLVAALNDLVKAVVILMLLTIPFAYFLERLLVGTPHIYRQIGWYVFFFLVTFAVLYQVHPAFAIATEPVVIFLAFAIILLSSLVIFILLSRFQQEIHALQGLRATVHSADVSRFGTVMAAIAMGISTMRRRPMRTLLTTVTVILLTFSILSFASFEVQGGILRRHVAPASDTRAIWIHHVLWSALPLRLADAVRTLTRREGDITERRWVAAEHAAAAETFCLLAAREDGQAAAPIEALVGLEPADLVHQADLRAAFPTLARPEDFREDHLFLPGAVAERLGVQPGDPVRVRGQRFVFGGATDALALTRFQQIDRTVVFPLDYKDESLKREMAAAGGRDATAEDEARRLEMANLQSEAAFLPCLNASQVGFVHTRSAQALGGRLVGLTVYPAPDADAESIAERIARVALAPVYVTLSDGTYRLYFTSVVRATGLGSLLVPILLGGLIVFGTMLGSVSDREQEIYAFSALGLAPAHVGMLFFAEASVYAVVGGLGGYILAQTVVYVASLLARFTPLRIPEMNYSSTNAVFAIVTVMVTVLLSTVYPALRASRSANPGVMRAWRLPRPRGDTWRFAFPFTVSEYDITGVMSFLLEHFQNFSDCSLGLFLSEDPRIEVRGRSLQLRARVSTAPFDLGVTQTFVLTSLPSEVEGVDEVHVEIHRLSGTRGDWIRTNRPFIGDLRKQFLIWRSLPAETMETYRRRTLEELGRKGRELGSASPRTPPPLLGDTSVPKASEGSPAPPGGPA